MNYTWVQIYTGLQSLRGINELITWIEILNLKPTEFTT